MAEPSEQRSEIVRELLDLSELQTAAVTNASYAGWIVESRKEYDERANRLRALGQQMEGLK